MAEEDNQEMQTSQEGGGSGPESTRSTKAGMGESEPSGGTSSARTDPAMAGGDEDEINRRKAMNATRNDPDALMGATQDGDDSGEVGATGRMPGQVGDSANLIGGAGRQNIDLGQGAEGDDQATNDEPVASSYAGGSGDMRHTPTSTMGSIRSTDDSEFDNNPNAQTPHEGIGVQGGYVDESGQTRNIGTVRSGSSDFGRSDQPRDTGSGEVPAGNPGGFGSTTTGNSRGTNLGTHSTNPDAWGGSETGNMGNTSGDMAGSRSGQSNDDLHETFTGQDEDSVGE